jgi:hypothetical protein
MAGVFDEILHDTPKWADIGLADGYRLIAEQSLHDLVVNKKMDKYFNDHLSPGWIEILQKVSNDDEMTKVHFEKIRVPIQVSENERNG